MKSKFTNATGMTSQMDELDLLTTTSIELRWLVPVFLTRGAGLTIVRHARKTGEKERLKIKTNMAACSFFSARLLCPVLNEFRVYRRLYLLVRPMLIRYVQDKLFLVFNVKFN